jgi:hypothetical protein
LGSKLKKLTILATACLALAACGGETTTGGDAAAVSDAGLTGNNGQVLSVVQVPGYTYVEVRNNGRNLWLAGNPIEIAEGDVISWTDAAMMRNFESKSLGRTFEELLFVSAIYKGANGAPEAAANPNSGVVKAAENAAGYTYIQLETETGQVVWLATPETDMAVGTHVSWRGGSKMTNFTSSSLNRTFDEILFVQGISVN